MVDQALDDLAAPSSLLSSRWSRDNLITGHPARLYNGRVHELIDQARLAAMLAEWSATRGPLRLGAAHGGVYTWDVDCGDFLLQVPRALDERGARGRALHDVPRISFENMRHFTEQGLTRFIVEPLELLTLVDGVPAAMFGALPNHHPIKFGRGALHVDLLEGERGWLIALGPAATADLLAEMVAALVYHYDPDTGGGTAITDVYINDGDFVVRRHDDGSFDVRLKAVRRREPGIGPGLLLLYLIQMMAYEDWVVDQRLVGLPTLMSNPSVAFEGAVRGRRYRHSDLGRPEEEGEREARRWIRDFGRAREGRAYRTWVERFLDGRLPVSFGGDLRERWWRLTAEQTKLGVLTLRARRSGDADGAAQARALRSFFDRLAREIGRAPDDDPALARINDLGRDDLVRLLADAQAPDGARDVVAGELLARWPYRSVDHLCARVPGARALRRLKSRLSFGSVVPDAEQGTLKMLGPAPREDEGPPPRPVANAELHGAWSVPPSLQADPVRAFPTFEAYMDAALHDQTWGYYARAVSIGKVGQGHFNTNPEELSPRYGRWMATWAFRCWRDMIARGAIGAADPFPVVELGAGNGRLARDFLDAVAGAGGDGHGDADRDAWRMFASRVAYRIYETSPALREKQRLLLGADAVVAEGDARRPAATLKRDFPGGLRGFVLSNEVPDAFGVHKVVLAPDGRALAALVVPRVEPALRDALGEALARRIDHADETTRRTFALREHAGDRYLDATTYAAVMAALAALPAAEREARQGALWFEEAYVQAAAVPELAAHLRAGAAEYATALAAEGSGVVAYVNVHAGRFMCELGSSLAAGSIVTIDYGDTTWGLIQGARRGDFPFRVYGDWQDYVPRPNDPYAAPGTQDLTADVSFTDLARAGEQAGLRVLHFGPERDVTGADLPDLLRDAADQESLAEFLGNPAFKVLVLGTHESDVFTGPLMTPLPLFGREQDVPKARRHLIPALVAALSSPGTQEWVPKAEILYKKGSGVVVLDTPATARTKSK